MTHFSEPHLWHQRKLVQERWESRGLLISVAPLHCLQTFQLEQLVNRSDLFFRQNPSFHQEPISAWDIQSPTVGEKQRNPWQFTENNLPHSFYGVPESTKILPRVATPVSTPVAPVAPLPIPQPDYSPPLGRPLKHEPNPYDYPLRSALKKPQPYGRTIF